MDAASPARLYATLVGAFLVVFGILGFFYSASFGAPGSVDDALGAFQCNGWANALRLAAGALGLLLPGTAARGYSLALGALFTVLAVWGISLDGDAAILGFLPSGAGNDWLNLALGLLGLLAAAGTPRRAGPRPRRRAAEPAASEPRAKPARG